MSLRLGSFSFYLAAVLAASFSVSCEESSLKIPTKSSASDSAKQPEPVPTPGTTGSPSPSPTGTPFPNPFPSPSPSASTTPHPSPSASPSPTPPLDSAKDAWFLPEPGSDVVEMFEHPEQWSQSRSKMSVLELQNYYMYPNCGAICKNNTWDRFVAAQAFQKIKSWNIPLFIGVNAVKPGPHCDAKIYANDGVNIILKNIKDQGGQVNGFTMDWPLASGVFDCHQKYEETADHVVNYVNTVRAGYASLHPGSKLEMGLWEGSPTFTADQLIKWLDLLQARGFKPDHYIVDFDHALYRRQGRIPEMQDTAKKLKDYCRQKGILFGVALWGNDLKNPTAYYAQVRQYSQEIREGIGAPDFIQAISWEYWVQKQNIGNVFPSNLPETDSLSHLSFFMEMRKYFGLK
jgi:hypothetical protein